MRSHGDIYRQEIGGAVTSTGARPDMALNLTDFHLTIGSLQVVDTGYLRGGVSVPAPTTTYGLYADIHLTVYSKCSIFAD